MTNEDLSKIEKLAKELDGSLYGEDVPKLCVEVRRLRAIEQAAEKYRAKLLDMLEASADALDEHDTDEHEAHYEAMSAAVWNEDGKALHRLLNTKDGADAKETG